MERDTTRIVTLPTVVYQALVNEATKRGLDLQTLVVEIIKSHLDILKYDVEDFEDDYWDEDQSLSEIEEKELEENRDWKYEVEISNEQELPF